MYPLSAVAGLEDDAIFNVQYSKIQMSFRYYQPGFKMKIRGKESCQKLGEGCELSISGVESKLEMDLGVR